MATRTYFQIARPTEQPLPRVLGPAVVSPPSHLAHAPSGGTSAGAEKQETGSICQRERTVIAPCLHRRSSNPPRLSMHAHPFLFKYLACQTSPPTGQSLPLPAINTFPVIAFILPLWGGDNLNAARLRVRRVRRNIECHWATITHIGQWDSHARNCCSSVT